jgi:hypothetical protein
MDLSEPWLRFAKASRLASEDREGGGTMTVGRTEHVLPVISVKKLA